MALKMLDESARSRLRSGVAIRNLAHCVGELVENSIDAGATCIAVRVDTTKFKVQVVDNGKGISRDDLNLLGERYMTSKCHSVHDLEHNLHFLGYRGEALASVVNVSGVVEICSRHCLSRDTYSKIFHNGKAMNVTLSKTQRPSVGTTVTVHEFFYNLPVRRKVISEALELEQVKKAMECIALVNPSRSFSLRNDVTGECILQTRKTYSVLTNFGFIFGNDKVPSMKKVSCTQGDFDLTGFVSTDGHHNKSLQFIYINGRIVKKTPLHSAVNNLLANSLLSRKLSRQSKDERNRVSAEVTSPKRTVEVHGVYILMLKCSRSAYDICLEPAKTLIEFQNWPEVITTFELLVKQFLTQNNLTLGPALTENIGENKAEKQPQMISTQDTKQPTQIPMVEGQMCNQRQERCVPVLEVQPRLQSRVVKCPKMHQTSSNRVTAIEESSRVDDMDGTDAVSNQCDDGVIMDGTDIQFNVQKSSSTSRLLHPEGSGIRTMCVPEAGLQQETTHYPLRCDTCESIQSYVASDTCQQISLPSLAALHQSVGSSTAPTAYGDTRFNHHLSQPHWLETQVCEGEFVSTKPQALTHSRSSLNQTPNSLFLTSFHSMTANSHNDSEANTVTDTDPQHLAQPPSISHSCPLFHSDVLTPGAQPTLQGYPALQHKPASPTPYQSTPLSQSSVSYSEVASSKKVSLGLNVPVRSPLQSSQAPSKLARLFTRKRHSARKGGVSKCVATQPSNLTHVSRQIVTRQSSASTLSSIATTNRLLASKPTHDITREPTPNSQFAVNADTHSFHLPSSATVSLLNTSQPPHAENSFHDVRSVERFEDQASDAVCCTEVLDKQVTPIETSLSSRLKTLIRSNEARSAFDSNINEMNIDSHNTAVSTAPPPSSVTLPSTGLSSGYHQQEDLTVITHSASGDSHSVVPVSQTISESGISVESTTLSSDCRSLVQSEIPVQGVPITRSTLVASTNTGYLGEHTESQDTITDCVLPSNADRYSQETMELVDSNSTTGHLPTTSQKPVWKECTDPVSGKRIYIHPKTGNVCNVDMLDPLAVGLSDSITNSIPLGIEDSGLGDSLSLDSPIFSNTSLQSSSECHQTSSKSTTFGAKPLRAAPHLSHDFASFLPRPKHQRTSFAASENRLDSTNDTIQSILTEPVSCMDMVTNKWRNSREVDELHHSEDASSSSNSFAALLNHWENPTFQAGHMDVLNVARDRKHRGQVKVHQVINRYKFSKEMFNNFKVLGQVDEKFIACLLDSKESGVHDLFVMIDQHAAHERVRLEELLNNLYEEDSNPPRIKSSQVQPPLSVNLQPTEVRLAKLFRQQLESTGVSLTFDRGRVCVSSLPSVLMEREASEVKRGRPTVAAAILQEMIIKHLELLQTTSGGCSTIPSSLVHVLNSQACHGAIKFGDPLTLSECESLIHSLSQCKLPFQCAHGRPSLIPILDLGILNQRYPLTQATPFPSLTKLKSSLTKEDHQE